MKCCLDIEKLALAKMAQSIYAARPIRAGDRITAEDLAIKSPGGFLPPWRLSDVIGTFAARTFLEDQPIDLADTVIVA